MLIVHNLWILTPGAGCSLTGMSFVDGCLRTAFCKRSKPRGACKRDTASATIFSDPG